MIIIYLLITMAYASCPYDPNSNLVYNGDFELPNLGGGYATGVTIPGWITTATELGRGTIYNSRWTTGQVIETDVFVSDVN